MDILTECGIDIWFSDADAAAAVVDGGGGDDDDADHESSY